MNGVKLVTFITLLSLSFSAKAQLYFKNKTSEPVWVAYAQWNDSKYEDHWFTNGWFTADPGQTIVLSDAIGWQSHCYYYAETKDAAMEYDGKHYLLVDSKDGFLIKNADKQYMAESNPNYVWKGFRKFRYAKGLFGLEKIKQTIVLEY